MPLLALLGVLAHERQSLASALVSSTSFEQASPGVWVDPAMPRSRRHEALELLAQARLRVERLFGSRVGAPTIILGDDPHALGWFTSNAWGTTHYFPGRPSVVIGPNGLNLDVMSHELVHAELFARLGYVRMNFSMPTWLDEGIAMQLDERPEYGEAIWRTFNAQALDPVRQVTSARSFFNARAVEHYVQARHEVARLRERLGPERFMTAVLAGDLEALGGN